MSVHISCPFCTVSLPCSLLDARPGVPLSCPKCERAWTPTRTHFCQVSPPSPPLQHTQVATSATIALACPRCAERNPVPSDAGGKVFSCNACGERVAVPRPAEIHHPVPRSGGLNVKCSYCSLIFQIG